MLALVAKILIMLARGLLFVYGNLQYYNNKLHSTTDNEKMAQKVFVTCCGKRIIGIDFIANADNDYL